MGLVSGALAGAALVVWGAVNLSRTVIGLSQTTQADSENWAVTIGLSLFSGGVPFLIGTWLMFRNLVGKIKKK